jgi:hypothetical protein
MVSRLLARRFVSTSSSYTIVDFGGFRIPRSEAVSTSQQWGYLLARRRVTCPSLFAFCGLATVERIEAFERSFEKDFGVPPDWQRGLPHRLLK